jgi:predicted nuclease with TOPRIM domain
MKAKELQAENEALKAQIMGLAFNLNSAEEKVRLLETELQNLHNKHQSLRAELNHYIMLTNTANRNQNDSRYY